MLYSKWEKNRGSRLLFIQVEANFRKTIDYQQIVENGAMLRPHFGKE
jgi:hypothetical protein